MNNINKFRKPQLAIILSFMLFYISCHQESIILHENQQSFNYSAFDFFKSNQNIIEPLIVNKDYFYSKSKVELSQEILDEINSKLSTNIVYPDRALDLINHDRDDIFKICLEKGWMNQKDIDLNNAFLNDLINNGFDIALSNFEKTSLKLQLSNDEFEKLNIFANTMKSFNFKYPNLFDIQVKNKNLVQAKTASKWRCLGASIALAAATSALIGCATIVACVGAVALHLIAIDSFIAACEEYL